MTGREWYDFVVIVTSSKHQWLKRKHFERANHEYLKISLVHYYAWPLLHMWPEKRVEKVPVERIFINTSNQEFQFAIYLTLYYVNNKVILFRF